MYGKINCRRHAGTRDVSAVCDMEHVTQVWVYARFMLPVGGQVICDLAESLVVQSLQINTFWLV